MGRVRTKTVKNVAKVTIEKYYTRLPLDLHTNKQIYEGVAIIPTKPLRNKISGYVTHLMGRLHHSRGISISNWKRKRNARVAITMFLEQDIIEVDSGTKKMLKLLDFHNIRGLQLTQPSTNKFSRRN